MSTTKVTIAWLAAGARRFSFSSSFMAARPRGVAALPSPKRLAAMFMEMAFMAGLSSESSRKRKRVIGRNIRLMASVRPLRSATRITPLQRQMVPVREITS